ncbi:beta-carotene hydroxylase [Tatumella sp. TA1]|uniref:sterol desaturase family protein n=1 Tax=Rosenbergiella collisarenosi TaxID=1544695 RepID=UPI0008F85EAA|nr:sterol desaturase family protein [Rosenbergiella collisarenosi]MBT0721374.1 beta-carotene hydroxylase [Rosenbergiella collisarenosi]QGX92571.1 beta-carotene hydroxylase [Tatumella sp. TA1]
MPWLVNLLIVIVVVCIMEGVATGMHKYVMHRWGWGWHRSHHETRHGMFEVNDLYALVFAGLAILLIFAGTRGIWPLQWVGAGMTLYGIIYFILHDGLVHQRWPFRYVPRRGYLRRLYLAHHFHHDVRGKEDCVSFGFIYAPPVDKIQAQLKAYKKRQRGLKKRPDIEK